MMTSASEGHIARDMTRADLPGVVAFHKACFPDSFFTVLGDGAVRCYYGDAVDERDSLVSVLEEAGTGRMIGIAMGTLQPGFRKRMMKRHPVVFGTLIGWGYLTRPSVRAGLRKRMDVNTMYGESASETDLPPASGGEFLHMLVGIHPECRGSKNAERLITYYARRIFELTDVGRIRGSVPAHNVPSLILYKRLGWHSKPLPGDVFAVWIDREECR
jgi:ribosomal protein S18 acetylase RimI-like enzyme